MTLIAAIAGLVPALGLTACGDAQPIETGGLASTTSTTTDAELPPPEGPLDQLVAERIGPLELDQHQGAAELRQSGAEDARNLSYVARDGSNAVVTLARFPSPGLARKYAAQYASVLISDQGFQAEGKPRPFRGAAGSGTLLKLDDGSGTAAAVWTTGPVFANALADGTTLETLLENAPFGES